MFFYDSCGAESVQEGFQPHFYGGCPDSIIQCSVINKHPNWLYTECWGVLQNTLPTFHIEPLFSDVLLLYLLSYPLTLPGFSV